MPTQTDVQQLIQGLVPGSVNNGNPNTVYNTSANGQQKVTSNPAWSGVPPQTDAKGNWFTNGLPNAANQEAMNIPGFGQTTPIQLPVWNLPQWSPPSGNVGTGTPPPTGGTGTPPKGGGTGGGSGTGGGVAPPVNWTYGDNGPLLGGLGDPREQNGGTNIYGDNAMWNQTFSIYDPIFQKIWGDPNGSGKVNEQTVKTVLDSIPKDKLNGLVDKSGKLDWGQLVDMVSEPWFQSNMYLSGLNKWDTSNILAGLAQGLTGLPINAIMNYLGEKQAFQDDDQNWLEKMLADHYKDNMQNSWATEDGAGANEMIQKLADKYGTDPANILKDLGIDPSTYVDDYDSWFKKWQQENYGDGAAGCVVVDSVLVTHDRAGDVKVGDKMQAINAVNFSQDDAIVSYSEAKLRPCVRIVTALGVELECSREAPIADADGEQVRAEHLLGLTIPVVLDGMIEFDTVTEVEDIGEQMVQHITCQNNFFLAGKDKGRYILHHNVKQDGTYFNPQSNAGGGNWSYDGGGGGPTSNQTGGNYSWANPGLFGYGSGWWSGYSK